MRYRYWRTKLGQALFEKLKPPPKGHTAELTSENNDSPQKFKVAVQKQLNRRVSNNE